MKFFRLFSKITTSQQVSKLENSKKFYEIMKSYNFSTNRRKNIIIYPIVYYTFIMAVCYLSNIILIFDKSL